MKTFILTLVMVILCAFVSEAQSSYQSTYQTQTFRGPANVAIGASQLPPTKPYHYSSFTSLGGTRSFYKESGTRQYVSSNVDCDGVKTTWVTTENYKNSSQWSNPTCRYSTYMVDGKSTAKAGTVSGYIPMKALLSVPGKK